MCNESQHQRPVCADPERSFSLLRQDDALEWDFVEDKFNSFFIHEVTINAHSRNAHWRLGYSAEDINQVAEEAVKDSWKIFRRKVVSGEFIYSTLDEALNYFLTITTNWLRRYLTPKELGSRDFKIGDNVYKVKLIDIDLMANNLSSTPDKTRPDEELVIIRETCRDVINLIMETVRNPNHAEIYLLRVLYEYSSKELGSMYGYAPGSIDNIVSKINKIFKQWI